MNVSADGSRLDVLPLGGWSTNMIDLLKLASMLGQEYLSKFLLGQDAIAKSGNFLRETNVHLGESDRWLGRQKAASHLGPFSIEKRIFLNLCG
jgi:hypothetical protein